jgi:hypothetical protein
LAVLVVGFLIVVFLLVWLLHLLLHLLDGAAVLRRRDVLALLRVVELVQSALHNSQITVPVRSAAHLPLPNF